MKESITPHEYPNQIDCAWLAIDSVGNVGAFITAGIAPVPAIALSETYGRILDVEEWIQALPITSNVNRRRDSPGHKAFDKFAERGLYAFDWTDVYKVGDYLGSYERVAAPTQPLSVRELNGPLAICGSQLVLSAIDFSTITTLDVAALTLCISPSEGA